MHFNLSLAICFCTLLCACKSKTSHIYEQDALKKISWIEGNWKGMDGEHPFYELYHFLNDTTIEITSYSWTGTDSTASSKSYLYWKDPYYYLGEHEKWKVTTIDEDAISMISNASAQNLILWKKRDISGWDAMLSSGNGEKHYKMEHIDHFK